MKAQSPVVKAIHKYLGRQITWVTTRPQGLLIIKLDDGTVLHATFVRQEAL